MGNISKPRNLGLILRRRDTHKYFTRIKISMADASIALTSCEGMVKLNIEVQPGAKREGITGLNEWRNRLQVAVRALPQSGEANDAVLDLLSEYLDLPLSSLKLINGHTSRRKTISIIGSGLEEIHQRLTEILEGI
ncbi:MAG: DUF167 domain-containing protein [Candidatus Poseidoniaceae archaeon]|jgi:hypothetical protein|nr:DUF167 domain-containing protein [Candidatus Poseidoniaceae archaeon]MDP7202744.1 DUF167 domain-containing protein [Candidatus Poseidoniaceae archaeon]